MIIRYTYVLPCINHYIYKDFVSSDISHISYSSSPNFSFCSLVNWSPGKLRELPKIPWYKMAKLRVKPESPDTRSIAYYSTPLHICNCIIIFKASSHTLYCLSYTKNFSWWYQVADRLTYLPMKMSLANGLSLLNPTPIFYSPKYTS